MFSICKLKKLLSLFFIGIIQIACLSSSCLGFEKYLAQEMSPCDDNTLDYVPTKVEPFQSTFMKNSQLRAVSLVNSLSIQVKIDKKTGVLYPMATFLPQKIKALTTSKDSFKKTPVIIKNENSDLFLDLDIELAISPTRNLAAFNVDPFIKKVTLNSHAAPSKILEKAIPALQRSGALLKILDYYSQENLLPNDKCIIPDTMTHSYNIVIILSVNDADFSESTVDIKYKKEDTRDYFNKNTNEHKIYITVYDQKPFLSGKIPITIEAEISRNDYVARFSAQPVCTEFNIDTKKMVSVIKRSLWEYNKQP